MKEYIKESIIKYNKEKKEYYLFKTIPIYIINNFIDPNININKIISKIENLLLYKRYLKNIEVIYIGSFKDLIDRNINAMFKDGCIFISNNITEKTDDYLIVKDIIHEICHSFEDEFSIDIYGDGYLESEFIAKKKYLYNILKQDGYNIDPNIFIYNSEYSKELDNFLYNDVGYKKLSMMISGLFMSPYSLTSISEYLANGFESLFSEEKPYLKQICPILYKKSSSLNKKIRGK